MSAATTATRAVLRDSSRVDFAQVRLVPAVRGGLGVSLPLLVLGWALHQPALGLGIAIGALNVAFSDQPGSYRGLARRMLLASVGGAISVAVGSATGGVDALAVCLTGVWGLVAGLLVALGPAWMQVGLTWLGLLIVYSGHPAAPADALGQGLVVLIGGLLQTGLAIVAWPIDPMGPERAALARLFARLAEAAPPPARPGLPPPLSAEMNDVSAALSGLSPANPEAERLRSLLNQGERIRLEMLALHDERDPRVEAALAQSAAVLLSVAQALRGRQRQLDLAHVTASLKRIEAISADLRRSVSAALSTDKSHASPILERARLAHVEVLAGQLRAVVGLVAEDTTEALDPGSSPSSDAALTFPVSRSSLGDALATLSANLTLQSAVCRHAIRLAVCVAAADLFGRALHLPWPYWVPLTVTVVLRPEFGTTFSRGLARVVGTLLGLALATGLVLTPLGGGVAGVLLIGVLMFATHALAPANMGLGAVSLSALVVLLLSQAGDPPQATIVARGLDTAVGAALSLAAYGSWPTWAHQTLPATLADLLDAYRSYARCVLASVADASHRASPEALAETRRRARLARTNALAALSRARVEPVGSRDMVRRADALLASSHRFVRALMALEAVLYHPARSDRSQSVELARLADDIDRTLSLLTSYLRGQVDASSLQSVPDLRGDERVLAHAVTEDGTLSTAPAALGVQADRIANSLSTMVQVLAARRAS